MVELRFEILLLGAVMALTVVFKLAHLARAPDLTEILLPHRGRCLEGYTGAVVTHSIKTKQPLNGHAWPKPHEQLNMYMNKFRVNNNLSLSHRATGTNRIANKHSARSFTDLPQRYRSFKNSHILLNIIANSRKRSAQYMEAEAA